VSGPSVPFSGERWKARLTGSSRAKLARADQHLDALYRETDGWGDSDPLRITRQSQRNGREHIFRVRYRIQPAVWRWGILLGDALFNLRRALDHLAFALAIAHTGKNPPDDEDKLAFPICSGPEFFKGQRFRIASLSEPAQAAIEKAQPYNRLKPGKWFAPLWWLDQIHNIDKHRFAHITGNVAHAKEIVIDAEPGTYQAFWNFGAVVDGTPILRLVLDRPNPHVYVDLKVTAGVALQVEEGQAMSVYWTTRHIRREVALVCRYLSLFFPP
jgi:hypothetical protein